MLHKEILTENQRNLLFIPQMFSKKFGLVGGTAIALQIGHRRSIDFDLFTDQPFNNFSIKNKISRHKRIQDIFKDEAGQYTFIINGVQFTFFQYPYKLNFSKKFEDIIKMPDLLTLAAMKVFALGRRAKWKDYVDLYFIIEKYHGIDEIMRRAKQIFGAECNEKLLRSQLAYFDDVSYAEKIEYMEGFEVSDKIVKRELRKFSVS